EAVRLGILKPVLRRLNDAERSMYVRSGSVFVWEESDDDAGIKRWTDGCMWSQSRMREPFLFYEEKLQEDRSGIASKKSSSSMSPLTPLSPGSRALSSYPNPPHSPSTHHSSVPQAFSHATISEGGTPGSGLVKQAYSAYVTQPGTSIRKKFHLTAYFTYADLPNLPTLDSEPSLSNIVIPQSVYRSGKSRTSGRNLANAAEPMRARQPGGNGVDSSPSPTSSPSSIDHPSLNPS
ncbi:9102_t:CDS:2, partial [Acaulospora colombiana]